MFTMTAALAEGQPLNTRHLRAEPVQVDLQGEVQVGGDNYCPKNAAPAMAGTHTMWSAFGESVNTYFVQLQEMVTVKSVVAMAEKLGILLRSHGPSTSRTRCRSSRTVPAARSRSAPRW